MLSNITNNLLRVGRIASVAALVALAGCQVKPLYAVSAPGTGTGQQLAAIEFSPAEDRIGQAVRNELIFLTAGGAGESKTPAYRLTMSVSSFRQNVLDEQVTFNLIPGRVTVIGSYTFTRISDGKVLKTAQRRATALLDVSAQEFAEMRAYRDAENRAAKQLAEFIRGDIATTLGRQ
ncbi:LPS assembly lipoprotein LptE [Neorhizobium sp. NPDC001467]|uniref:LPS assembly lipoprotein LptE n=1 Tax=Neorhizobium sp. NPDC001467 TaxID=3390595 RepID=UPI003D008692